MDLIGFNGYLFCSSILPALVASLLSQKLSSSNVGVLLHSIVHDLPIILEPLLIISLSVYARLFISTPNPSCFCCFKKPLLFPFFSSLFIQWERGGDIGRRGVIYLLIRTEWGIFWINLLSSILFLPCFFSYLDPFCCAFVARDNCLFFNCYSKVYACIISSCSLSFCILQFMKPIGTSSLGNGWVLSSSGDIVCKIAILVRVIA